MNIKRLTAFLLCVIMILSLVACGGTTGDETSAQEDESTEAEVVLEDSIRVAAGTITGQLNSAYASEDGDKSIANLIMPTLYTYDRSGQLLTDASAGKTIAFDGTNYTYRSLADISSVYDAESDISTYTIKLGSGYTFSDGTAITADDLIFTYYVLCDESFDGEYSLNEANIIGIRAYQLNNTAAPTIEISSDEVEAALANPSDEIKSAFSESIIKPIIEEGRTFCEENWQKYVDRGYGDSAQELFIMLYTKAIDSDYDAEGKTFDDVVEETISLFGMNYKSLARIQYGDVEYLNTKAYNFVEKQLYEAALESAGGEPVSTISGITKVDESTVSIRVLGKGASLQKKICDIPVLSRTFYGENYNYEANEFGVTRGDVSIVKSHSSDAIGYGPYTIYYAEGGRVLLSPNENYQLGLIPSVNLEFVHVEEDSLIDELDEGGVDMVVVDLDDDQLSALDLCDDNIAKYTYNDNTYEYFGINATKVIGVSDAYLTAAATTSDAAEDASAETTAAETTATDTATAAEVTVEPTASKRGMIARNAFGIILTAVRESAIEATLGDAAAVIQYPGSSSYWGIPKEGDAEYELCYAEGSDGTAVTSDNFLDVARTELKRAGYTFDASGKVVKGKGIKTTFTVAIPSYQLDDAVMTKIYQSFKSNMNKLGFGIKVTYFDQLDEFVLALAAKSYDFWMAQRSTESVNLANYYTADGEGNYYGLKSKGIANYLDKASKNPDKAADYYKKVYQIIMNYKIEVPVYQHQSAIVYNSDVVKVNETAGFTEYFNLFDDFSVISLASSAEAETTALETTTAPAQDAETTAAETTVAETTAAETTAAETTVAETTTAETTAAAQ